MNLLVIYWNIFREFFQIGLLSFGGGYATLPFLYDLASRYGWYTPSELSQMVAVASITPGPVGINVATYAGMKINGVLSAFIATSSEILPSIVIVILVSKLLNKLSDNFFVKSTLDILKPTSCALLTYVALNLIYSNLIISKDILGVIFFSLLLIVSLIKNKDPLWYIAIGGLLGLLLKL